MISTKLAILIFMYISIGTLENAKAYSTPSTVNGNVDEETLRIIKCLKPKADKDIDNQELFELPSHADVAQKETKGFSDLSNSNVDSRSATEDESQIPQSVLDDVDLKNSNELEDELRLGNSSTRRQYQLNVDELPNDAQLEEVRNPNLNLPNDSDKNSEASQSNVDNIDTLPSINDNQSDKDNSSNESLSSKKEEPQSQNRNAPLTGVNVLNTPVLGEGKVNRKNEPLDYYQHDPTKGVGISNFVKSNLVLMHHPRVCYSCSSTNNPSCWSPNRTTPTKYCRTGQDACVAKVFKRNGYSFIIRDCSDKCERRTYGLILPLYESCTICHSDLCSAASSVKYCAISIMLIIILSLIKFTV